MQMPCRIVYSATMQMPCRIVYSACHTSWLCRASDIIELLTRPKRFELLTPRFVVWCSIQLSYGRFLHIAREMILGRPSRRERAIAIGLAPGWQGSGAVERSREHFTPAPARRGGCRARPRGPGW